MKNFNGFILSALLIAAATLLPACSSSNKNPSGPTYNTTGPIIVAFTTLNSSDVFIADSAGNTGVANTSATLVTGGVTTPMNYGGLYSPNAFWYSYFINFGMPYITGNWYSLTTTYNPGQVYQFNVGVGGTTYTDSVTAVGGNPTLGAINTNQGVTCSWTAGTGNRNFIHFLEYSYLLPQIGPPLSPDPYTIQNSTITNETSSTYGTGGDEVGLFITNTKNPAFSGSNYQSTIEAINWGVMFY